MSVYGRNYKRSSYPQRQLSGGAKSDIPPVSESVPQPEKTEFAEEKQSVGRVAPPNISALLGKLMPNGIDSDTLLIAALLLMLLKEGGDIKLVLALGYILL